MAIDGVRESEIAARRAGVASFQFIEAALAESFRYRTDILFAGLVSELFGLL